jgi:hypothetical protein
MQSRPSLLERVLEPLISGGKQETEEERYKRSLASGQMGGGLPEVVAPRPQPVNAGYFPKPNPADIGQVTGQDAMAMLGESRGSMGYGEMTPTNDLYQNVLRAGDGSVVRSGDGSPVRTGLPEDIDPQKAAAFAQQNPEMAKQVMAKGQQASNAVNELRNSQDKEDSWFDTFSEGVGNFFGDKENMLGLALAFNSLRYQPDQGLAAVLGKQLETVQTTSQRNKTAQMLLQSTDPKQKKMGQLMLSGMSYKDAVAAMKQTDFDKKWELAGGDPKKYKEMFGGSMVNIEAAEKAEDVKRAELFAKRMSDLAEGRTTAVDAKASVEALMILGENPDLNAIPNLLRGFIPRGVNAGVDAYKAAMVGVAQAQRQKGTGAQSDKDIDLLVEKAGPVSTDIKARRIAQQMLKDKAQRNIEMGDIANQYSVGLLTKEEAVKKMAEIEAKPLISDDLRGYLNNLGAKEVAAPENAPDNVKALWQYMTPEEREEVARELGAG